MDEIDRRNFGILEDKVNWCLQEILELNKKIMDKEKIKTKMYCSDCNKDKFSERWTCESCLDDIIEDHNEKCDDLEMRMKE